MELNDDNIMILLGVRDGTSYRDMADTIGHSVNHTRGILSALSDDGLIDRKQPDKRVNIPWKLTKKGYEVLTKNGYHVFA